MKYSFTTLETPTWDITTICTLGEKFGYQGVDFRGYRDALDITTSALFTTHAQKTVQQISNAGLEVSGISSSIIICDPSLRQTNLEEAKRTIDVTKSFGCKNIRVFGGGDTNHYSQDELLTFGRDCFADILSLDRASDFLWLLETHDSWTKTSDCTTILNYISHPAFGIVWDIGHTSRVSKESPAQSSKNLGNNVAYVHIKDAIYSPSHPQSMEDGWRYVLPGQGQLPLEGVLQVLMESGYEGWIVFEHEKRWHPELPNPNEALPEFINWLKRNNYYNC